MKYYTKDYMRYYLIKLINTREFILKLTDKDVKSTEFQPYHGSSIKRIELTQSGLDKLFSLPSLHGTPKSSDLVFMVNELSDEYVNRLISTEEVIMKRAEHRIAELSRLLPSLSEATAGYIEL